MGEPEDIASTGRRCYKALLAGSSKVISYGIAVRSYGLRTAPEIVYSNCVKRKWSIFYHNEKLGMFSILILS